MPTDDSSDAILAYVSSVSPDERSPEWLLHASRDELRGALAVLYERMRLASAGARGVTAVASRWATTRRTRRRVNAAVPHIIEEVDRLRPQIQRLEAIRQARFPTAWERLQQSVRSTLERRH